MSRKTHHRTSRRDSYSDDSYSDGDGSDSGVYDDHPPGVSKFPSRNEPVELIKYARNEFNKNRKIIIRNIPPVKYEEIKDFLKGAEVADIEISKKSRHAIVTLKNGVLAERLVSKYHMKKLLGTRVEVGLYPLLRMLCITNLPPSVGDDEEEFAKFLEDYGSLEKSFLMRDNEGNSKGYGFVEFAHNREKLMEVREELDGLQLDTEKPHLRIHCEFVKENILQFDHLHSRCLLVTNLPALRAGAVFSKELFEAKFSELHNPSQCKLVYKNSSQFLHCGVVQYHNSMQAETIRRRLRNVKFDGQSIDISFVTPGLNKIKETMDKVSQVMSQKKKLKKKKAAGGLPVPSFGIGSSAGVAGPVNLTQLTDPTMVNLLSHNPLVLDNYRQVLQQLQVHVIGLQKQVSSKKSSKESSSPLTDLDLQISLLAVLMATWIQQDQPRMFSSPHLKRVVMQDSNKKPSPEVKRADSMIKDLMTKPGVNLKSPVRKGENKNKKGSSLLTPTLNPLSVTTAPLHELLQPSLDNKNSFSQLLLSVQNPPPPEPVEEDIPDSDSTTSLEEGEIRDDEDDKNFRTPQLKLTKSGLRVSQLATAIEEQIRLQLTYLDQMQEKGIPVSAALAAQNNALLAQSNPPPANVPVNTAVNIPPPPMPPAINDVPEKKSLQFEDDNQDQYQSYYQYYNDIVASYNKVLYGEKSDSNKSSSKSDTPLSSHASSPEPSRTSPLTTTSDKTVPTSSKTQPARNKAPPTVSSAPSSKISLQISKSQVVKATKQSGMTQVSSVTACVAQAVTTVSSSAYQMSAPQVATTVSTSSSLPSKSIKQDLSTVTQATEQKAATSEQEKAYQEYLVKYRQWEEDMKVYEEQKRLYEEQQAVLATAAAAAATPQAVPPPAVTVTQTSSWTEASYWQAQQPPVSVSHTSDPPPNMLYGVSASQPEIAPLPRSQAQSDTAASSQQNNALPSWPAMNSFSHPMKVPMRFDQPPPNMGPQPVAPPQASEAKPGDVPPTSAPNFLNNAAFSGPPPLPGLLPPVGPVTGPPPQQGPAPLTTGPLPVGPPPLGVPPPIDGNQFTGPPPPNGQQLFGPPPIGIPPPGPHSQIAPPSGIPPPVRGPHPVQPPPLSNEPSAGSNSVQHSAKHDQFSQPPSSNPQQMPPSIQPRGPPIESENNFPNRMKQNQVQSSSTAPRGPQPGGMQVRGPNPSNMRPPQPFSANVPRHRGPNPVDGPLPFQNVPHHDMDHRQHGPISDQDRDFRKPMHEQPPMNQRPIDPENVFNNQDTQFDPGVGFDDHDDGPHHLPPSEPHGPPSNFRGGPPRPRHFGPQNNDGYSSLPPRPQGERPLRPVMRPPGPGGRPPRNQGPRNIRPFAPRGPPQQNQRPRIPSLLDAPVLRPTAGFNKERSFVNNPSPMDNPENWGEDSLGDPHDFQDKDMRIGGKSFPKGPKQQPSFPHRERRHHPNQDGDGGNEARMPANFGHNEQHMGGDGPGPQQTAPDSGVPSLMAGIPRLTDLKLNPPAAGDTSPSLNFKSKDSEQQAQQVGPSGQPPSNETRQQKTPSNKKQEKSDFLAEFSDTGNQGSSVEIDMLMQGEWLDEWDEDVDKSSGPQQQQQQQQQLPGDVDLRMMGDDGMGMGPPLPFHNRTPGHGRQGPPRNQRGRGTPDMRGRMGGRGRKRSFSTLLPAPEPSPEGPYIGQHSQGLGGHYPDTYRKRPRFNAPNRPRRF